MADEANRPLLGGESRSSSPDPSRGSRHSRPTPPFELSSESTPLLHRRDDDLANYGTQTRGSRSPSTASENASPDRGSTKTSRVRWPTLVALALLLTAIMVILAIAFATPAVVKDYTQQAAVFKPAALSIDSTTPKGVRARVQGDFVIDSGRVNSKPVRDIGRFVTWLAKDIETGPSEVEVYLPEYGNVAVGNATLPSLKMDIRNGHHNHIDLLTDITAGDIHGIKAIAMDWIEGRLGRLSVKGKAIMHPTSGLIGLGTQILTDTIIFEESDFPALPDISVTRLNVHDTEKEGMAVDVSLAAWIDSPVSLKAPGLGFEILVPNCSPGDPYILVANAKTAEVQIQPGQASNVSVGGIIRKLPEELTSTCPGEEGSPLDFLVSSYIQGRETTIYVRGADAPLFNTPAWIVDLLRRVTVPLPVTGHALDNLVKNFTMSDTHFSLPDPFAEPDTPEAQPRVSALVKVLIRLPKQMNFSVDVPRVRATADVFYKEKRLGVLKLDKWQNANSTHVEDHDGSSALLVEFAMKDAPLQVTDNDLLTEVIQAMVFGSEGVELRIAATVDTKVLTGLGRFAVHSIPAEGQVRVKTPSGTFDQLHPRLVSLALGNTTESSIVVLARLNFTNPTSYAATVPFVDLLVLHNDTAVAHVVARNISVVPGNNTDVSVDFLWSPLNTGGSHGVEAGRALLSAYVSGSNTTVTIRSHRETIPALPELGEALSRISLEIPVPRLSLPGSPKDDKKDGQRSHFIQDATLYLWSSTADFILSSPLPKTSIFITTIDAAAFHEKDEPVGRIHYRLPFEVPPGLSQTPRLPVDLALGGVGREALRKALGQSLELDAVARVGVRILNYVDVVLYRGKGIAAKVRI
ncbi:hypothetical protein NUU61_002789 [Penicillium alfredii]|uniref:Pre-rRNA processing protein n=1 Tax=Penicillium alfredii TaxID=1506179 RepID=A0A9W9FT88_9EURO|nr:uncharacterized protein NUU61_002789 [Penicillium alfredii]KAJ5105442.1 hypothetical protein NUU61_002789 [Penicillium alfredii]